MRMEKTEKMFQSANDAYKVKLSLSPDHKFIAAGISSKIIYALRCLRVRGQK